VVAPARCSPQASRLGAIAPPASPIATSRIASLRRIEASRLRAAICMTNAVSAAPTYSNAAVESGPASRPANATIGVVTPNATAATAARSVPVARGERLT
jgi:hypothetical protein